MTQQIINVGAAANDRTGDSWRDAFIKVNANTSELYTSVANNVVVINSEADFPVQDASTITLSKNFLYFIGSPVSTAKSFNGDGINILGLGITPDAQLTYTGVGVMFTMTSGLINIRNLIFDCPNGTIFSMSGSGGPGVDSQLLVTSSRCFNCMNIGTLNGLDAVVFDICDFTNVTGNGFVFAGTGWLVLSLSRVSMAGFTSSIAIDLGTAIFGEVELRDIIAVGDGASTAISGLAANGNIVAGSIGEIKDCNLSNIGTALAGIDEQDIRWRVRDNAGTVNSRYAADGYITIAETVTINTISVFEEIAGVNWVNTTQDRFTTSTSGVITYNGQETIEVKISGIATVEKVGGGADEIAVRAAVNWVSGGGLVQSGAITTNSSPTSVPINALTELSTGDNIRLIVANNGSTSDVVANVASLSVVSA